MMRGGGVCWLSTAIWNAALQAGLPTENRQNHFGFVPLLGAGTDATNTLMLRNDSSEPVTIRTWVDSAYVHAELQTTRPLDRTAEIEGPYRLSSGNWMTYQDITWADGSQTINEFPSYYFW